MATFKVISDTYDITKTIRQIKEIDCQIGCPSREGMISALRDAREVAPKEIMTLEVAQGCTIWLPASHFSDDALYRRLPLYRKGLEIHIAGKTGEEAYRLSLEMEKQQ